MPAPPGSPSSSSRPTWHVGTGVICFGVAIGRLRGQEEEQRVPVLWVFRLRDDKIIFARAAASAAEARELVAPDAAA